MSSGRRRAWIVFVVLARTLAGRVPLAQAQEQAQTQAQAQKGPTLGGHIGFVLPMGFPVRITVKGSGRLAFDLEFVPQINTQRPRLTTLTLHPGLIYGLGHASEWEDG